MYDKSALMNRVISGNYFLNAYIIVQHTAYGRDEFLRASWDICASICGNPCHQMQKKYVFRDLYRIITVHHILVRTRTFPDLFLNSMHGKGHQDSWD